MLSNAEKITRLRIARSENVGPATFWQLLKMYGTAERALNAMPELAGYGGKKGYKLCSLEKIEEEIYFMKSINGRYAFFEDELYPPLLREIVDAPPVLTFLGDKEKVLSFYEKKMVSIVGARNSSICANKFCENLSLELGSHGVVVVSGMARGIDTSAHTGGLKNGTIAVLAGGGMLFIHQKIKNCITKFCKMVACLLKCQ